MYTLCTTGYFPKYEYIVNWLEKVIDYIWLYTFAYVYKTDHASKNYKNTLAICHKAKNNGSVLCPSVKLYIYQLCRFGDIYLFTFLNKPNVLDELIDVHKTFKSKSN